jgi:GR25 family glycosyltransferase involved in LPS biosynthesis
LIISNRINLNASGFRKNKNHVLNEFGCYLAHYKCWEYVLNNNIESCLILEDGIKLLRNDYENLSINSKLDILFVNKEMEKYNENVFIGYGLQGYIITLNGAKKLIDKCHILNLPIDLQLRNYCNNKILNGDILNNSFIERDNNRVSSISNNNDNTDTDDLNEKQNINHNLIQRIIINLINKNINLDDLI